MGMPSLPSALPLGMAVMVSRTSFRVRSLTSSPFISVEIRVGVLDQHSSRASAVPGVCAFDA